MSNDPEKLMIRVGDQFEASASGKLAIKALILLISIAVAVLSLQWW